MMSNMLDSGLPCDIPWLSGGEPVADTALLRARSRHGFAKLWGGEPGVSDSWP